MFPEMAFTGYTFENATAITPYLELPRTGPTSRFCAELAARLQCHVIAGYPELLPPEEREQLQGSAGGHTQVGANSAVLYGPDGAWVGGYRKTHLFETDRTWAKPGSGFATFQLPSPLRNMSVGICMDLNPQPPALWTQMEGPYELGDYCLVKKTNILVMLNAWLDSGKEVEEESDWQTLNYWAARLNPMWEADRRGNSDSGHQVVVDDDDNGKETVIIVCNRSGEENGMIGTIESGSPSHATIGKTFAGSSAIYSMQQGSGRPKLLDMFTRKAEGVRIWNILV
ncbi:carbon-nitrogen hydrolase [Infundibulicybe gibba]|nr:carbon-nitrogen hydrolase [Infundibulicybe gibba]